MGLARDQSNNADVKAKRKDPTSFFPAARIRTRPRNTQSAIKVTFYGTITVNSPGVTNWITPPQMHMSFETLSSVG